MKRAICAGMIGEIIEWYDFALYGFLAPVFAHLFFPSHNPFISLMATLGGFAVGFLMRPIGGIIFGHYGDRIGRQKTLAISLLIMAIPTFLIGLLPTYATLGLAAPTLLILLRLIQGLSCGGEFIGSMVFMWEHANFSRTNLFSSFSWTGAMLGTFFASIVTLILSSVLNTNEFYTWGWRLAFFLGLFAAVIGFYIRWKTTETPLFNCLAHENKIVKSPLITTFKSNKKIFFQIIAINIQIAVFSYITLAYMTSYLKLLGFSFKAAVFFNSFIILLLIMLIPLGGKVADKIGSKKLLTFSMLSLLLTAYFLYQLIDYKTIPSILLSEFILSVIAASAMAAGPSLMANMVNTNVRYTCISLAYNIAFCIFGGTAPLIATYLIHLTNNFVSPAYYLMAASIISLMSILID